MRRLIIFSIIVMSQAGFAQNTKLDSLFSLLQTDISDSVRASTLIALSREARFTHQDSTLIWSDMALELAKKLDNKYLMGMAIFHSNYTYELQGKYREAMEKCIEALDIFNQIDYQLGIGKVYNYIGIINFKQNQYERALEAYNKSLDARVKTKDENGMGWTYNNIGATYERMNEYDQALEYYNKSLEISQRIGASILTAASLGNIGIIYEKQGQFEKALDAQLKSLQVFIELDNKKYVEESQYHIANIYLQQNKFEESEQHLLYGLGIAKDINDREGQQLFYESLITLKEQTKDYEQAVAYFKALTAIKDSLFNINSSKQLNELQTKYESEQNNKENQILKTEVRSKNQIIVSSVIVIALLVALSVLLYRFYTTKHQSNLALQQLNQQVMEQKEELESQSEQLSKANKEIQLTNENLEQAIEIRTAQIRVQNDKLMQYAFSNAHRVRGPLARILGVLQVMKMEGEDNENLLLNINQLSEAAHELDEVVKELNKVLESDG